MDDQVSAAPFLGDYPERRRHHAAGDLSSADGAGSGGQAGQAQGHAQLELTLGDTPA